MHHSNVRCRPDDRMTRGFEAIRERLGVPARFPPQVAEAAAAAVLDGPRLPPDVSTAVRDARDLPFVAIDPAGSRDLDQVFHAERTRGGYRVHYGIADVAAFVPPDGPVDREARGRGVTLYSPDIRTPLHPEVISEDAASLLEGADRPALLWTLELDADGELTDARIERAQVRNRAQLSYRQAQHDLATAEPDAPLALLAEVGRLRQEREADRGAVSLALPSQEVVSTPAGSYEVEFDESFPVEGFNAQISLLTGIAASRIMLDGRTGLLRTLPEPDPATIADLRRTAAALGIEWPVDVGYAERVRSLRPDSAPRIAFLNQAARGLRGAGYEAFHDRRPDHATHSAIASTYAHVTAPLRRLCDRFTNEILLAQCAGSPPPSWAVEALDELPAAMGAARSRDRNLERAMVDFVEAVVLEPRVGEVFGAVVTNVDDRRDRVRIQLRDPAIVARMDADGLRLGDDVQVRLVATDPSEGRVRFEPAA